MTDTEKPIEIVAPPAAPLGALAVKIAAVMAEVTAVEKRGRNDFHKYNYAQAADVSRMIGPLLAKHRLVILPTIAAYHPIDDEAFDWDVAFDLTLIDGDSGEQATVRWYGRGSDKGDKALYKAYTAAMKTFVVATFAVPTGDDPEADTGTDQREGSRRSTRSGTQGVRSAAQRTRNEQSAGSDTNGAHEPATDAVVSPERWAELISTAKANGYETREQLKLVAAGILERDAEGLRLAELNESEFAQLEAAIAQPAAVITP